MGQLGGFLLALPVLVLSMVAHEYAHGYAALRQGDNTAKLLGRLTFNPVKHIDPWMSLLLPAMLWFGSGGQFLFGGAKPVPVNPRNYRHYRRGDIIVSLAGIAANLVLAVAVTRMDMLENTDRGYGKRPNDRRRPVEGVDGRAQQDEQDRSKEEQHREENENAVSGHLPIF